MWYGIRHGIRWHDICVIFCMKVQKYDTSVLDKCIQVKWFYHADKYDSKNIPHQYWINVVLPRSLDGKIWLTNITHQNWINVSRWSGSTTQPRRRERPRVAAVLKISKLRWVHIASCYLFVFNLQYCFLLFCFLFVFNYQWWVQNQMIVCFEENQLNVWMCGMWTPPWYTDIVTICVGL